MNKIWIIILILLFSTSSFSQITLKEKLTEKKHQPICVAYSADGQFLAAGDFKSTIKVFNLASKTVVKNFEGLKGYPIDLVFTPDGKHLVSGGKDSKVTVWTISDGTKQEYKGHKGTVRSVSVSPDGKYVASAADDGKIIIRLLSSGAEVNNFQAHKGGVNGVDFSPNGDKLVSGGADKMIKVWNVKSAQNLLSIPAHSEMIRDVKYSPDGSIIASAGDDKVINFWSADDGEQMNSIRVHTKWVQTIAFSPDGQYLVSGGHDNLLLVTHIDQGKIVFKSEKQPNYVLSVDFNPDGKTFASAFLYDEEIRIWDASSLDITQSQPQVFANKAEQKDQPKAKPIAKPTIAWETPTSDITVEQEATQISACINSNTPLRKVTVLQNENEIYSFDRKEIMMNEGNCTFNVKKNIFLREGANTIVIKARNPGGEVSLTPVTITYKKPVNLAINWPVTDNFKVTEQNFMVECCIESSASVTQVELFNNETLVANVTGLISKTDQCKQLIKYPLALSEGNNTLKVKAKAGDKLAEISKVVIFEKPVIAENTQEPVQNANINPAATGTAAAATAAAVTPSLAADPVAPDPYKFALIIGNEDYSSYQTNLSSESNVDFARNDATEFKEYAIKYIGIPEENIIMHLDARYIQMRRALKKMNGIIEMTNGKAEIFFYYAGHGFPHEKTKEPYFVPVDGSGSDLEFSAIKQKDVYDELTKHPAKRLTVFVDACFSGGARNQGLVAARGVKIQPKESHAKGSMVVFTASSEDQSSLPYKEKEHGMFTYFLLNKIKETNGHVDYKTLSDYIKEQVGVKSYMINSKRQVPQTNVSPELIDTWKSFKLSD
jgi:protein-disulfide isomerase